VLEIAPIANARRPSRAGRRLSVLAVTSELPWPLNTGGHLRTFHLLRTLAGHGRCRLIVGSAAGQHEAEAVLRQNGIAVRPVILPGRPVWREALRAAHAALRLEPYVFYRRHLHARMREALAQEIQRDRPDALYLDHLDSLVLLDGCPSVPVVIDMHNVYSLLLRREAREHRWPLCWYLSREARLLARMEERAARRADALLTVSEQEADYYRTLGAGATHVVPNGVDTAAYADLPTGRPRGTPLFLYVGTMSWAPNASAACFLAHEVLPRVRQWFPEARLRVIGKDPPPAVRALAGLPGVEVTGAVPSMLPHLREAHALAVPLTAGGGTRLKILEAFAAGLPVVSTPVGCEGLRAAHGEHLLVAQREHFAEALRDLFGPSEIGARLARRARTLARDRFDWSAVGRVAVAAVADAKRSRAIPRTGRRGPRTGDIKARDRIAYQGT
jgi:glycosyltransferase involved in cell wall biosynthesis